MRVVRWALLASARADSMAAVSYSRADGVKILHDPYAPGMAEKYGRPGKTDAEGFDPYRDSVGPGIYGGVVQRDAQGRVQIGRQYQNHNPRPGPVYAGGGYTPISAALGDEQKVRQLLATYPDLVNDVSTGGAQPLHMCGMSKTNQHSTALLIAHGADIEALDTYGMTPLHRMASNNLAVGAKALLAAGADPAHAGQARASALQIAQEAGARDVVAVLQRYRQRAPVGVRKIVVAGASEDSVNGEYEATPAAETPAGFAAVCRQNRWDVATTWQKLNAGATWFRAANDAYIYFNQADKHWWIDAPEGHGVFKARAPAHAPPQLGWAALVAAEPPQLVATFREL